MKTTNPMYGFSACPRTCIGSTKSHDTPAAVTSAVPSILSHELDRSSRIGFLDLVSIDYGSEFKYAIRLDIWRSVNTGHLICFAFIRSSMRGP